MLSWLLAYYCRPIHAVVALRATAIVLTYNKYDWHAL